MMEIRAEMTLTIQMKTPKIQKKTTRKKIQRTLEIVLTIKYRLRKKLTLKVCLQKRKSDRYKINA